MGSIELAKMRSVEAFIFRPELYHIGRDGHPMRMRNPLGHSLFQHCHILLTGCYPGFGLTL